MNLDNWILRQFEFIKEQADAMDYDKNWDWAVLNAVFLQSFSY